MAERRMFAKSIVTSDAFLDMPMSARCLYFTLGMFADDDGFVNSPKSIMRQVGATNDDMGILLAKKFIIGFENGVIVIKHWRINNYLQKDRTVETKYTEEKARLIVEQNGSYSLADESTYTQCIQDVYTPYTQDRIDKDSIDKNNNIVLSNDNTRDCQRQPQTPIQGIVELFNTVCIGLPQVKALSEERKRNVSSRWKEHPDIQWWDDYFHKIQASDFLCNRTDRETHFGFDWILKPSNMQKILDGNYDNRVKEDFLQRMIREAGNDDKTADITGFLTN